MLLIRRNFRKTIRKNEIEEICDVIKEIDKDKEIVENNENLIMNEIEIEDPILDELNDMVYIYEYLEWYVNLDSYKDNNGL